MEDPDALEIIDDDLWDDIKLLFESDLIGEDKDEISHSHTLNFGVHTASGFRFRYQSEIDKKSYSAIKGEKNQSPSIKIKSSVDLELRLDLVTEGSSPEEQFPHFNTLYEVSRLQKYVFYLEDGTCSIAIKKNYPHEIKLDFIGIRKWKLKEAIPRIRAIYPYFTEIQAKSFFNSNKESVKLRASLFETKSLQSIILSNTIKSQISKENKTIKIQHISPKTVADCNETLIIVLEKKITGDCNTYLMFDNMDRIPLYPNYVDGQTFVYTLPPYLSQSPTTGKIRLECSDSFDEKPIRFQQPISEIRKRKTAHYESDIPLKKPTNYDSPQPLFPESGNMDSSIEHDGPRTMDIGVSLDEAAAAGNSGSWLPDGHNHRGNDSCKDSGIHSDNKSSNASDIESDDDDEDRNDEDSNYESDEIEIEGVRRKPASKVENLNPINFPPRMRSIDSRLEPSKKDQVANKIFSEVARIGHDFAFGKQPSDLFERIEKQLPVVFTLQDDVGDTPLNNAILKGNVIPAERILKVVQAECKWALDITNTSGQTALILAPACDVPPEFIVKLLNAGLDLAKKDDLGKSAITYAIEYMNTAALSVLLEYIKHHNLTQLLKRDDKVYFTLLQIAVMNSFFDGVKMLLTLTDNKGKYMVDVNELALMNDDTALHIAVERNVDLGIVKLLLERSDININHKKNNISTVLHVASKMNLTEVISLLKSHQAEDINDGLNADEVQESCDEMDYDDDISPTITVGLSPVVVAMTPEVERPSTINIIALTDTISNLNIKGDNKRQLIELLMNGDIRLTVDELKIIVRPAFVTLFSKYKNTHRQDIIEIIDILDRFNCLPNSMGQLFENLREINRPDMIEKVMDHFKD